MEEIKFVNIQKPFSDQKPGTSGLRKSTVRFQENHYLEIFIESTLRSLSGIKGSTLILGGDGRYGNKEAIKKIIGICAAHNVGKVIVGKDGLLSTPAASNLIRINNAFAGIILSASHNPGGPEGDFGVKVNVSNGGPAPELITDKIYSISQTLTSYKFCETELPDLMNCGSYFINEMELKIVDGIEDYVLLMEKIFDLDQISDFLKTDFPIIFDAMNAVTGPYAKEIFLKKIGLSKESVMNGVPLPDFGSLHPDPNLTYADKLADLLLKKKLYSFGAACDGDGDRNMILGRGCFINPSDSLAVLTANTNFVPGYKNGIAGVARSMPTSTAVDQVASKLNIPCYETPTGWKFFGNLLDSDKITICGEESFGTGSNHVREKDGLWAVLFWLQILSESKCSVNDLIKKHWQEYGRNYYSRHDYESIPSKVADQIYGDLEKLLPTLEGNNFANSRVKRAINYSYEDPIDKSISLNQGLKITLEDNSRIIVRLSGTGTKGSTLRLYFENYVDKNKDLLLDPQIALNDLIVSLDNLLNIKGLTKMDKPTVIT
tara:strand:+ start:24677 stop:26314 length:1638 start_codon:yes stop_codon:yes gene_type:complete